MRFDKTWKIIPKPSIAGLIFFPAPHFHHPPSWCMLQKTTKGKRKFKNDRKSIKKHNWSLFGFCRKKKAFDGIEFFYVQNLLLLSSATSSSSIGNHFSTQNKKKKFLLVPWSIVRYVMVWGWTVKWMFLTQIKFQGFSMRTSRTRESERERWKIIAMWPDSGVGVLSSLTSNST